MRTSRLTSFTAGALCMLVLGSGTAVAATGGKFIIGKTNYATTTTTLSNSKGSALSLKALSSKPVLVVSNSIKVANLNADKLDDLDSTAFALRAAKPGTIEATADEVDVDENGTTDTLVAYAACPAGSQVTGGGIFDTTQSGVLIESAPVIDGSDIGWEVAVGVDEAVTEDPTDLTAFAVCWNPGKTVPSATVSTTAAQSKAMLTPQLREAAAAKASQ